MKDPEVEEEGIEEAIEEGIELADVTGMALFYWFLFNIFQSSIYNFIKVHSQLIKWLIA